MTSHTSSETILDSVDRAIVDALHRDGRAPWAQIAETVGVSAATVRKRFDSLHREGIVRVVGATDVARLGLGSPLFIRFSHAHADLATLIPRLQHRKEVRFLTTVLGTVDLVAELVLPPTADISRLVADLTAGTSASAESMLITHAFRSGQDWAPPVDGTDPTHLVPSVTRPLPPVRLSHAEAKVLGLLMHDGRTPLGALAHAIGKSPNTASRIVDGLQDAGLLDFRTLVEPRAVGFETELFLWLEVEPVHLQTAALTLADNPSTKYLTTTTGRCNLSGQIALRDRGEIFRYSTEVLGTLPGVRAADLSVQVATHKRVWTSLVHGRYTTAGQPLDLLEYLRPDG